MSRQRTGFHMKGAAILLMVGISFPLASQASFYGKVKEQLDRLDVEKSIEIEMANDAKSIESDEGDSKQIDSEQELADDEGKQLVQIEGE